MAVLVLPIQRVIRWIAGWQAGGYRFNVDLNGDRIADRLTMDYSYIIVEMGVSQGVYASPSYVSTGNGYGYSNSGFSVADLNGDKKLDLVVTHSYTSEVSVLLGNGDGSFAAASNFSMGSGSYYGFSSVTSLDVNGDGKYDLIIANQYSNQLLLSLNDGALLPPIAAFTEQTPTTLAPYLVLRDVDGNWVWSTLSIQITGNAEAADNIYLPTSNPGDNGIWLDTVNGNLLMAGSTQIGSADAASVSDGTVWHFTFNANVTAALGQAALRSLMFNNTSDAPGVRDRTVTINATDATGATVSGTQTITIAAVDDAPTGSVEISSGGNNYPTPTHWLHASNTLDDVDGMGPISYQWQRMGIDIAGATGDSYRIGYDDIGLEIRVVASYLDGAGHLQSVASSTAVTVSEAGISYPTASLGDDTILGSDSTRDTVNYFDLGAPRAVKVDLMRGVATGGGGSDRLVSIEDVWGSAFGDTITGNDVSNMLNGVWGNDTLYGNGGDDMLIGDHGEDKLFGGAGDDILNGGGFGSGFYDLPVVVPKNAGKDILNGGDGNDIYYINSDDSLDPKVIDIIQEGSGKNSGIDTVHSTISYTLVKNVENLFLDYSDSININATGNASDNVIFGNETDNILNGKLGNDTLTGGEGADGLMFDTGLSAKKLHGEMVYSNVDTITDFTSGVDSILLDHYVFSAYKSAFASATRKGMEVDLGASFVAGDGLKTAANANIHLIYDSASGNLYYDADGAGGKDAMLFVTLVGKPELMAGDLYIV